MEPHWKATTEQQVDMRFYNWTIFVAVICKKFQKFTYNLKQWMLADDFNHYEDFQSKNKGYNQELLGTMHSNGKYENTVNMKVFSNVY